MIETIAVISVAAVGIAWGFFTLGRLSTKVDWAWSRADLSRFWFEQPLRCKLKMHDWETVFDRTMTAETESMLSGRIGHERVVAEKHACSRDGCPYVRGYVRRMSGPNEVVPVRMVEETLSPREWESTRRCRP